jgi:hypothetical protein
MQAMLRSQMGFIPVDQVLTRLYSPDEIRDVLHQLAVGLATLPATDA